MMASSHFQHLSEWQVIICKECRYAVWPRQVAGHLTNKQHRLPRKEAVAISDEIDQWHGIVRFPGDFDSPKYVEEAVDGMPVYTDGVKCEFDQRWQ